MPEGMAQGSNRRRGRRDHLHATPRTAPTPPARARRLMRAVIIRRRGNPDVLEATELSTPTPAHGEALVRVGAVSVNSYLDVTNRAHGVHYRSAELPHV